MRSRLAVPIDSKRALAALAVSNTLGVLVLFVIPLLVGATARRISRERRYRGNRVGLGTRRHGRCVDVIGGAHELLNLRRWTWIGVFTFVAGNLLSLWSVADGQWQVFLVARGVVGAGEGILFAISSGLAAQTAQPDRTFSWFTGTVIAASVLCFWMVPIAMEWLGPKGAFPRDGGCGMLAVPALSWTPSPRTRDNTARASTRNVSG